MSLAAITTSPRSIPADTTPKSERTESLASQVGTTLSGIAAATGVSATVSFSSKALHALEHAGEAAVDAVESGATQALHGVEDLAGGAWDTLKSAAVGAEHLAETGWDGVTSAFKSAGDAASSVASSAVFVAAAGEKTLRALL
jgi:hypothetical protein